MAPPEHARAFSLLAGPEKEGNEGEGGEECLLNLSSASARCEEEEASEADAALAGHIRIVVPEESGDGEAQVAGESSGCAKAAGQRGFQRSAFACSRHGLVLVVGVVLCVAVLWAIGDVGRIGGEATPAPEPQREASSQIAATRVLENSGCAQDWNSGVCMEFGKADDDCCAMPGSGSCRDGYTFEQGGVCFVDNGAVATCCAEVVPTPAPEPQPELQGRRCAHREESFCTKDGDLDEGCCAAAGSGNCTSGFDYYPAQACYVDGANTTAVATCCVDTRPSTKTSTETSTATSTPTQTATGTSTPTQTATETSTPTQTSTETSTSTGTATETSTSTGTATETPTSTQTATETLTSTETSTSTKTTVTTSTVTSRTSTTTIARPLASVCARSEEDCRATGCCQETGFQCYARNASAARCLASCTTEPSTELGSPGTAWDCSKLGPRAPGHLVDLGAWPGEDCSSSHRCRILGYGCFARDGSMARCRSDCRPGEVWEDGVQWSCERVGGYEHPPEVVAGVGEPAGTSLYCFTVASVNDPLVLYQRTQTQGIYTCDGTEVVPTSFGDPFQDMYKAWHRVYETGAYARFDWVVRVDPDTVIVPGRLREQLGERMAPQDAIAFLADQMGVVPSAMAVISARALETYVQGHGLCEKYWDQFGDREVGGQTFLRACLRALGAGQIGVDALVLEGEESATSTVFLDLGAGCCHDWSGSELWSNHLGDLEMCKDKCREFPECAFIMTGFANSNWCTVLSARSSCGSLDAGPTDCGSSGANGVRTWRQAQAGADLCRDSEHLAFRPLKVVDAWEECWKRAQDGGKDAGVEDAQEARQALAEEMRSFDAQVTMIVKK